MAPRGVLLVLSGILVLSIAYYFVIALPSYNEARLALERQRYADERKRIADEARERQDKERTRLIDLDGCIAHAELNYTDDLKFSGTVTAKGSIPAEQRFLVASRGVMQPAKQTAIENCYRRYPPVR